jgi:hypothetical protein
MKKLLLLLLAAPLFVRAQIPEDILRYSYYPQGGTARSLSIGGAMVSLGGDLSAVFTNPAGLGNYRTGEIMISPGMFFRNNSSVYRDNSSGASRNAFGIGTMGVVFGSADPFRKNTSSAFSFAFTQQASFNNSVNYKGLNNFSSFSEQWAEEMAGSGQSIDQALANPAFAYGTAPALYTYLLDTFRINGNLQLRTLPEFILDNGQALRQEKQLDTRGGLYELAIGYAKNHNDKFLYGFTLGIPFLSYRNNSTFTERDTSANANNNFESFTYNDNYSSNGAGLNLKAGLIYKPSERVRLGLALHTPTFMFSITETRTTTLTANTENYNGSQTVSSNLFTNNLPGEFSYSMVTPWRFMIGGSYVIREIEDVRKQKGFISADIEYITHGSGAFQSANENPTTDELNYYKQLNRVVSGEYRGSFNFRLGGELKFNTIMTRLGAAYSTNPYKDAALSANRLQFSGGLGYRHKGIFIDLTYVHTRFNDVDFGYRLQDKANTFASLKNRTGQVVVGFGVKF